MTNYEVIGTTLRFTILKFMTISDGQDKATFVVRVLFYAPEAAI